MKLQDLRNLLDVAQSGDDVESHMAMTDVLMEVINNHMDRHLARYIRKNTVGGMDADDIRQIFLIGCSKAIREANTDIGNPMLFILQKGKWSVVDELRSSYRKNLRQYCHNCDSETRLNERSGEPICPKCGATGTNYIERIQTNITDDGTLMSVVEDEQLPIEDVILSDAVVDEFRERLTGRKADVFDLIVYRGFDRDSCKNYISSIADELGVSRSNVNLRLRAIKKEWNEYMEEMEEMEECIGV